MKHAVTGLSLLALAAVGPCAAQPAEEVAADAPAAPAAPKKRVVRPSYKWVEAAYGFAYTSLGGDFRARSENAWRLSATALLAGNVYAVGSYDAQTYDFADEDAGVEADDEQFHVGLGAYHALQPRTHLIASVTYENISSEVVVNEFVPPTTETFEGEADGIGLLVGLRTVSAGAAELALSYKHRMLKDKEFSDEEIDIGTIALLGALPVARKVDLTLRVERHNVEFDGPDGSETGHDEQYLVGLRIRI